MKIDFTLFFLLVGHLGFAAPQVPDSLPSAGLKTDVSPTSRKVNMRCKSGGGRVSNPLLYVVDGVVVEHPGSLRADEIDSIRVLKNASSIALYGEGGTGGVIIIKTKTNQLVIRDSIGGAVIQGATVIFTSGGEKVMTTSDEQGRVQIKRLSSAAVYEMTISSAGYVSKTLSYSKSDHDKLNVVQLQRDIRECEPVIIRSGITCILRRITSCGLRILHVCQIDKTAETDTTKRAGYSGLNIFPNPASRNSMINLEITNGPGGTAVLQIFELNGKIVNQSNHQLMKGNTRLSVSIDPRWSAGIYFVRLIIGRVVVGKGRMVIN